MAWLTSDLLADVRRRAMLPTTSTLGLADSDLLAHADNEMASRMVPLVTSVNEEFYVQTLDVPLVAGQSAYRLPNRSAGGKLRDVTYLLGSSVLNLARIEPEQLTQFVVSASGTPSAFYMEAGTVNLVPAPAGGGTLRMKYFVRPGRFTNTATDYGIVTAVTTNTLAAGTGVFAGTFSGSLTAGGLTFDVIAYRPPFEYLAIGASGFTFSAPNIALLGTSATASTVSLNIAVGDYITHPDVSPIIQLPVELHSLLVQRVVCAVMETLNYGERLNAAERVYERMEEAALKLITPRVDGAPRKMRGVLNLMGRYGMGPR